MLDVVTDWVKDNWIGTIVTIIITLILGYFFYWLSNRSLNKFLKNVNKTTLVEAKERILNILEGEFVEGIEINPERIQALITSISNKMKISENVMPTKLELLEEVMLRFRESRQLSSKQKQDYILKIEEVVEETNYFEEDKKENELYSTNLGKLVSSIENLFYQQRISSEDKQFGLEKISLLKNRLNINEKEKNDAFVKITSLISSIVFMMGFILTFMNYLDSGLISTKLISTMLFTMILAIIIPFSLTILREFVDIKK